VLSEAFNWIILIVGGGLIFGLLGGLLLYKVIGLYIEGSLGAVECVLGAAAVLGAVVFIATLGTLAAKVVVAVIVLGLCGLIPVLSGRLEKRSDRIYYDERIEQYRTTVEADPRNLAARNYLAEALYKQGRLDESIEELTQLVTLSPGGIPEAHRLNALIQERDERAEPSVTCASCGHQNHPSRTKCANCESDLRIMSEIRKWLMTRGLKQIVISSAVAIAAITILVSFLTMLSLPLRILVIALALMIVIGAELLYAYGSY